MEVTSPAWMEMPGSERINCILDSLHPCWDSGALVGIKYFPALWEKGGPSSTKNLGLGSFISGRIFPGHSKSQRGPRQPQALERALSVPGKNPSHDFIHISNFRNF